MRKYFYILLCTVLVLTGTLGQAFAATMDQVADGSPYGITIKAKLQVKKEFKDKSTSNGDVVINDSTATTGTFELDDYWNPIGTVTGTLSLIKGKKVAFEVDADGLNVIEATIIDWVTNYAADEGVTVTDVDLVFDLPVKTNKFKVKKKTGTPKGKAKLKLKGRIEALVDGERISRKFKYQVTVKF